MPRPNVVPAPPAWLRGRVRMRVAAGGSTGGWSPWRPNLVLWGAADLVGALLCSSPDQRGLQFLAVGTGDPDWDGAPPPADPSRQALHAEVARVALVPGKSLTYDPATGTVAVKLSLPAGGSPGLATGPLREMGLFGGAASARPGSGTLVNHVVHERIDVQPGEAQERQIRLVLDEAMGRAGRDLVGALLARVDGWAGLTHVGLGDDGSAVDAPDRLRSERFRRPLERGAVRWLPDSHTVEAVVRLAPGEGPDRLAEVGLFGGTATGDPDTGSLLARDTFAAVDRSVAHTFRHRMRVTLVSRIDIVVPDVTGRPLPDARQALLSVGLAPGELVDQETDTTDPGRVVEQHPAADAVVVEATPVRLVVAVTPRVEVPAIVGLDRGAAESALHAAGLAVAEAVTEQTELVIPAGRVLGCDPSPGVRVPLGTEVRLTVAVAQRVTVPDVRGQPLGLARLAIEAAGLAVAGAVPTEPSDATEGYVLSHVPAGGADVARGSEVTLTVAVPRTVPAPNLVGRDLDATRAALATAGAPLLPPGVTSPPALGIGTWTERGVARGEPTGVVLEQSPPAGAALPRYATVEVVIATPAATVVPDLDGLALAEAGAALAEIGLRVGRVETLASDSPPGSVVGQEPAPGTAAAEGDRVVLYLAAGQLATVPLLIGGGLNGAREALTAAGLVLGTVTSQPEPGQAGLVLAQDPGPGLRLPAGTAVAVAVVAGVPDLVGLPVDAAASTAEAFGLSLSVTHRESEGPSGVVLDQHPAAGSSLPGVGTVSVVVSTPVTVEVPDVTGRSEADAATVLAEAGLGSAVRSRPVDDGHAGLVVGQEPAGGERANLGLVVALDVAQQGTEMVEVPDLTGLPLEHAKGMLAERGLELGKVIEQPGAGEPGTVLDQVPKPGEVVPAHSWVTVTVAVEGTLAKVPDIRGLPVEKAKSILIESGLEISIDGEEPSPLEPGTVTRQQPEPDAIVPAGSVVLVIVASPEPLEMPGVIGRTRTEAVAILTRLGLRVTQTTVFTFDAPRDTVVAQDPQPGAAVMPGGAARLVIAQLPFRDVIRIPT